MPATTEYCKVWRDKNREHYRKQRREYMALHRKEHRIHCQNWVGKNNLISNETTRLIQKLYEENIKKYGTLTCELCFKEIEFGKDSVDHKTPISKGGLNEFSNLCICHLVCNLKKGKKTFQEWLEVNLKLSL